MKIGVSSGDLNGIGIECFIKSLSAIANDNISFVIYINRDNLSQYLSQCNNIPQYSIENDTLKIANHQIEIKEIGYNFNINFGKIDKASGENAYQSIIYATKDCINNNSDAVLTLPISKESCYIAGMNFPGHTELIADLCNIDNPLMILYYKNFRTALQTVHIPIKEVADKIKKSEIINTVKQFAHSLEYDFSSSAKIAILGLNPHSGENGNLGKEELFEIIPAIYELRKMGVNVDGPFPADGFFGHSLHNNYSGILAMYHDQGLIALKYASQGNGVNFTAALPIIRTSPDHGTGFNIAGKGIANYLSTLEAIRGAMNIYNSRINYNKSKK
ncbi:MAG TPA: 4-hydroxythreonine-4-phosphate dehydrogenase PdxA [Candidatus Kapabacteria bacterium]|nr:4-hydroxythreonine-4-phosphate dehydrogenase PdxA [Candidatus Kapabacteria bacterium]